ncbi:hypothetical protein BJ546DRAFT_1063683 [Cryomyces antarcticus]|nr:hypothetical protein LTR60_000656 [Cryomyces antarcticus]
MPKGLFHGHDRDWRSELKPAIILPASLTSTIPQKRTRKQTVMQQDKTTEHPTPNASTSNPELCRVPAMLPSPCIPVSAPLKDPRPDFCAGISKQALAAALEPAKGSKASPYFLRHLQEQGILITDPGRMPLNLHFPFFVLEAKSGATGGTFFQ